MNPFQVFTKIEFENLVLAEMERFKLVPNDVNDLSSRQIYFKNICETLNHSISEYQIYKTFSWQRELCKSLINCLSSEEIISYYLEKRRASIIYSEEKFKKENLTLPNMLLSYYFTIRKAFVYTHEFSSQEKIPPV